MEPSAAVPQRVVVVGLGTVGRGVVTRLADRPGLTLLGAVDHDARKLDRARREAATDVTWAGELDAVDDVDVAIVTAGPFFDRLAPTLRQLIRRRTHVVSDCAELAWPWLRHPHLADVVAGEARKAGVAVLGIGAWDGFLPAGLPFGSTGAAYGLRRVKLVRTVDVRAFRPSVRRRAGLTLTPQRFRALAADGRQVGFAGAAEAVTLLAHRLGLHPSRAEIVSRLAQKVDEDGRPVVRHVVAYRGDVEIEIDLTLVDTDPTSRDRIELDDNTAHVLGLDHAAEASSPDALLSAAGVAPTLGAGLRTAIDVANAL